MLRVLSELLGALRREGFEISTAQAIDVARAVDAVGLSERSVMRAAIGAVVVDRSSERAAFDRVFEGVFREAAVHAGDLWSRLRARGFSESEVSLVRDVLEAAASRASADTEGLRALAGDPRELDHLLRAARIRRTLAPMIASASAGFFAQEVEKTLGVGRMSSVVGRIGAALADAFGADRGDALAAALRDELAGLRRRVRDHVEREPDRKDRSRRAEDDRPMGAAFATLDADEARAVRRALGTLAERLRGAVRVRRKRARRGSFDARATIRRARRTGGVPVVAVRRRRRDDRPKLVVVCDVSESVRAAARFMLELVAAIQELYSSARSFVFVGEVAETTELFRGGTAAALAALASGRVVDLGANSNYGRAFTELERRIGADLDRRDTVVVLGDGRTNRLADGADAVARLRDRAGALFWLCPEPSESWGAFDSAMPRYARASTQVLPVRNARELELAARAVVRRAR